VSNILTHGILQAYDEEQFHNAIVTGTAPLTSYALQNLTFGRPDWRVKWGTGTVTITFTLPGPVLGDVFVLPMSNLDASVLTLTNGAGLSVPITILPPTRWSPDTTAVNLTLLQPNNATRTSNVWNLVIAGNSKNVTLGAAVLLYSPVHHLIEDFLAAGPSRRNYVGHSKLSGQTNVQNQYMVRYIQSLQSFEKTITLNHYETSQASIADFEDWYDANYGGGLPGFLFPNLTLPDEAYYGVWDQTFFVRQLEAQLHEVDVKFYELSKGIPLL
jgi:hypothetical protein